MYIDVHPICKKVQMSMNDEKWISFTYILIHLYAFPGSIPLKVSVGGSAQILRNIRRKHSCK